MAQRVQIILEDDYDGGTADETVSFALDGAEYEIDLSSKNATGLREALAPWVAHARKIGGRRKRATKASGSASTSDIRAWALAKATMSAAAAASRQTYGRRTRRLMLDLSVRVDCPNGSSQVSPVATPASHDRRRRCALGEHASPRALAVQGQVAIGFTPGRRPIHRHSRSLTKRDRQGGISGGRVTVVTRHRTLVDRAAARQPECRQPGVRRMCNKASEGVAD